MSDNTWRENIRNPGKIYQDWSIAYPTLMQVVRFVISGGTATAVNLGILFTLTHLFSFWYLLSSAIAFMVAFWVSFAMQKLWTFGDTSKSRASTQALFFFAVILVGLGINTSLLFVLVEYAHLHYLVAQLISGVFIAVMNYFSYKRLVFRNFDVEFSPKIPQDHP